MQTPQSDAFRTLVIVNPASASGATGRRWDKVARLLEGALGEFEHVVTTSPDEATRLTRAALRNGVEMIVAVGGDGTLNEVANGFFDNGAAIAPDAVLGVVALGTGSDVGRTLGQKSLESACAALAGRTTRTIDVGLARFTGHDGKPALRIFINVLSFGVSGLVARLVNGRLKAIAGHLAFMLATVRALLAYRDQSVTLEFDTEPPRSLAITNCAFCNGRFFGAGMQVAPAARIDDGQLDVTVWSGFGVLAFISKYRKLFDGTHVREQGTQTLQARAARASSPAVVLLELDGESVGTLPVQIQILPATLRLKV
jgi:YegS/Rv2252/BmrU family lipid kinase